MDPPTPVEPPPPAYELEHDYDRKIVDALERSLSIANQAQPTSLPPGEEEWEEWDEARFQAAAQAREQQGGDDEQPPPAISRHSSQNKRLAGQNAWQADHPSGEGSSSTSSMPAGQPNRRLPASPPAKERPSWYSEARLDASAGSGSRNETPSSQIHQVPLAEDDPDEPDEPLPPFAAVGPSLEGPPFEEVVRLPPRMPPASNVDSPPQSPLDSVDSDEPLESPEPQPHLPPPSPTHRAPPHIHRAGINRHRPTSPHQSLAPSLPRASPAPMSSSRPPPLRFDPSVAYAKHHHVNQFPSEADSKEPVDASAFYNSAVSSFLGSSHTPKKNKVLAKELASRPDTSRQGVRDPYSPLPPVPPAPAQPLTHQSAPPSNSYYPVQVQAHAPTQYASYPQPLPQQPHPQQPYPQQPYQQQPYPQRQLQQQQVAPGVYGQPFHGSVAPGPLQPPPPPPSNWPPPNNMYGSGYGR